MRRDLKLEALVIKEAKNLKKYAKKSELEKLNHEYLNGNNKTSCIYGQMTGNCLSKRAYNLILKCATQVFKPTDNSLLSNVELNGAPHKLRDRAFDNRLYSYHSPIEQFLYRYQPQNSIKSTKVRKLVNFLQGKTKILKF